MKVKAYENIITKQIVYKDEALDYALEQIGIKIQESLSPEQVIEQMELKQMLPEWYFSGNWIETEVEL